VYFDSVREEESTALVFGGHSPIAISISRQLSVEGPVIHVSRSVDQDLIDHFSDLKNVSLVNWGSFSVNDIEAKLNFLEEIKVHSLVFSHRYRSNEVDSKDLDQFVVEVYFPYRLVMNLMESGKFADKASILFVTSPAARYVVTDQPVMYHLTKASVNQLVRHLSLDLSPSVKVNAISPGSYVLKKRNLDFFSESTPRGKMIREFLPSGDIPSVEGIACLVKFLLSEENTVINGQILDLSGGYLNIEVSQLFNSLIDK
jgi:enoyl-[acyl-carrier-protein] reductase (NADH)